MMEKILFEIVKHKENRLKQFGPACGEIIPAKRNVPLITPELAKGIIICEIKRRSPSEGKIQSIDEPCTLAHTYASGGADAISVLTERDHFNGSLRDMIEIKSNLPQIPVLRKDFIIHPDEIEVSFRCGADMVLLIAAIFIDEPQGKIKFETLYRKILSFGLLPLVEIHNERELAFIRDFKPALIGINSRDLKTFQINRSTPHALRERVKGGHVLYESGIHDEKDAFFPGISDFSGLLVGTAIVKAENRVEKIRTIKKGFFRGKKAKSDFYRKLLNTYSEKAQTLVKICGITNLKDLQLISELEADICGFILADSPRQISLSKLQELSRYANEKMLRVAVVTPDSLEKGIQAVKDGVVDAIQVHGTNGEQTEVCYYNAKNVQSVREIHETREPFVLYDAFETGKYGGTGKQLSEEIIEAIETVQPFYGLAGGITPENISSIIQTHTPLLVDICSGVERSPGLKDESKLRQLFKIIRKRGTDR